MTAGDRWVEPTHPGGSSFAMNFSDKSGEDRPGPVMAVFVEALRSTANEFDFGIQTWAPTEKFITSVAPLTDRMSRLEARLTELECKPEEKPAGPSFTMDRFVELGDANTGLENDVNRLQGVERRNDSKISDLESYIAKLEKRFERKCDSMRELESDCSEVQAELVATKANRAAAERSSESSAKRNGELRKKVEKLEGEVEAKLTECPACLERLVPDHA